jgi:ubiquitin
VSAGRFEDRAEASDDLVSTLPVNPLEKDPFSGRKCFSAFLFFYEEELLAIRKDSPAPS